MPNMSLLRLAHLSIIYKIEEIIEANGWVSGNYRVVDGYPSESELRDPIIWPTVSVGVGQLFGRDVELGSKVWPTFTIAIDVFAITDSQRDDLSYILWNELNENSYNLYDFNSAFPTILGDYTGIPVLGNYGVSKLTITPFDPEDSTIEGLNHHSMIDGLLLLPNL